MAGFPWLGQHDCHDGVQVSWLIVARLAKKCKSLLRSQSGTIREGFFVGREELNRGQNEP
jgi:hypothetical protein